MSKKKPKLPKKNEKYSGSNNALYGKPAEDFVWKVQDWEPNKYNALGQKTNEALFRQLSPEQQALYTDLANKRSDMYGEKPDKPPLTAKQKTEMLKRQYPAKSGMRGGPEWQANQANIAAGKAIKFVPAPVGTPNMRFEQPQLPSIPKKPVPIPDLPGKRLPEDVGLPPVPKRPFAPQVKDPVAMGFPPVPQKAEPVPQAPIVPGNRAGRSSGILPGVIAGAIQSSDVGRDPQEDARIQQKQARSEALAQALLAKLPRAAQANMRADMGNLQYLDDEAVRQNKLDSVLAKYSTMLQGGGRSQ